MFSRMTSVDPNLHRRLQAHRVLRTRPDHRQLPETQIRLGRQTLPDQLKLRDRRIHLYLPIRQILQYPASNARLASCYNGIGTGSRWLTIA